MTRSAVVSSLGSSGCGECSLFARKSDRKKPPHDTRTRRSDVRPQTPSTGVRWRFPGGPEGLAAVCLIFVGLVLRGSYLLEIVRLPTFAHPISDAAIYDHWARGLATGNWTVDPHVLGDPRIREMPFVRPPGYPYFLAMVYRLSGCSPLAIRLVQMGMGLASCALLFGLARAMFGRGVALLAAGLMSTYWIFIHFEGELSPTALSVFLLLGVFNLFRLWLERRTFARALGAGVVLGLLVITRPESLLLLPLGIVWGWWTTRGTDSVAARGVSLIGVCAGPFFAMLSATIRNYLVSGELLGLGVFGALNFYAGNNELADGVSARINTMRALGTNAPMGEFNPRLVLQAFRAKFNNPQLGYKDGANYAFRLAFDYIRENPGRTLRLMGKKALLFWGPTETPNDTVIYLSLIHI